jgi:putative iron-regulated protein
MKKTLTYILLFTTIFIACKKNPEPTDNTNIPDEELHQNILTEFSANVTQATYNDLYANTQLLTLAIKQLDTNTTNVNLNNCRQLWRNARAAWEKSEGFLFGPVATENIDPRMDTWPTDYVALDSVLANNSSFTVAYINSLDDALKGFHPIEYLIFGLNGNKDASQLTTNEKHYLVALAENLEILTQQLAASWNPSVSGNYHEQFVNAGNGSTIYSNKRQAFEEMINAMIGICEEVADGKIGEPLTAQDPMLEESPYSFNSMTDFTNNIRSVQNCYFGRYLADGTGLEDFVKSKNLSLDATIKNKIIVAINSLNAVTVPFGVAIISQQLQLNQAITAINDLKNTMENDLLPLVQLQVK